MLYKASMIKTSVNVSLKNYNLIFSKYFIKNQMWYQFGSIWIESLKFIFSHIAYRFLDNVADFSKFVDYILYKL